MLWAAAPNIRALHKGQTGSLLYGASQDQTQKCDKEDLKLGEGLGFLRFVSGLS